MGRKKVSGQHSAPRKPVQLPEDWLVIAKKMAEEERMPVTWFIVDLIKREAEKQGVADLPSAPWKSKDLEPLKKKPPEGKS